VTPIKRILDQHKSVYAAAKALSVTAAQLARLERAGALVDESGQVWIKSKTILTLQRP
jgi:hypothetical protein